MAEGVLFRLVENDPTFGLNAGDVLRCQRYQYNPYTKWVVLERVSDGYDPRCTVYRHQIERMESSDG